MKRKFYLSILFYLFITGMSALPTYEVRQACDVVKMLNENGTPSMAKTECQPMCDSYVKTTKQSTFAKGEVTADMVSVTLLYDVDDLSRYRVNTVMIYNPDWSAVYHPDKYDENGNLVTETTIQVPVGEYDIYSSTWDSKNKNHEYIHIEELVTITSDTTLSFKVTDAKNLVCWEVSDENDALLKPNTYLPYSEDLVEAGNVNDVAGINFIILKGYGPVREQEYGFFRLDEGQSYVISYNVNDLSDRYQHCVVEGAIGSNGTFYLNRLDCGGTGPFPLKNFSSDYLACEEIIQPTPMGRNSVEQPWSAFGVNVFVGNHQVYYHDLLPTNVPNSNFPFPENGIIKSMINAPIIGDRETTDVNVAFRLGLLDYEAWRVDIYNMEDEYGNIVQWVDSVPVRALTWTPKMMTNNDNMMVYLVNSKQANTSEVGIMNEDYPGHPGFCFTFNQKKDIIGNCCPLNVVTSSNQFNQMYNAKMISVNSEHMGRSGELFGVGNLISTMTAKFNGEQVYSGKYAVDSLSIAWLIESITQGKPDGAYEMSFTNANVEVDNNYGQNTTTIYFDQTKEDWNSPVLKMLQLRDVDNNVTDRFNTPEEGIILFAGGDFQPCSKTYLNEYGYERTWNYDDCQPMTVEVSYAPYSTGEWHALEGIEHQAEYDDIPGLGFFYSASLANVSAMSANGWYDLCFRLQDESGNWMEQVLSPAFHINAMVLSGANEIMTDFTNESVIYNLVGQRMRGDLSSLPKGIYIMVRQLQDGSLHSTKVCK